MRDAKTEGLLQRGGVWYIRKTIRIGTRRAIIRESTGCTALRDARKVRDRRVAEVTAQLLLGDPAPAPKPLRTWGEAAVEYVADLERRGKDSGRALQDIKLVINLLGALPLDHVHQGVLQPWIDSQQGIRASGTIDRVLRTVSTILHFAAEVLRDGHTPWLTTAPPRLSAPDWGARQPRPITWAEQDRLIESLPEYLVWPVLFALATGARQAEITTLKWDQERQIDGLPSMAVWWIPPEIRKANSRKAASQQDGRFLICNRLARLVLDHQRTLRVATGSVWVFPSRDRTTHDARELYRINGRIWRAAIARAGLEIRVHDLRHTFGARAADAGIPLDIRRSLLGHEHRDITLHYSRPGLARLLEEAERIVRPIAGLEVVREKAGRE